MAGLYVFFGPSDTKRLASAAARIRFFDEEVRTIEAAEFSAAWVGHDDVRLFGPAFDPRSGVHVLTSGRVSWDEPEWQAAERLTQFEGGLGNRILLEKYLAEGVRGVERHSGPAALLIFDPRVRTVHLWSDHFGYHPIFLYEPGDPRRTVIATVPDAIADDEATRVTRDPVSSAEFLSAWRVTPPHTYYREIRHAGAAAHWTWNLSSGRVESEEYWRPHTVEPFPDIESAAEELASAVKHAVRVRTLQRLAPIVSFTSGGMDSRAVLFAASSPADVAGLNLYDVPNKESRISERLCEAAGCRYVGFARDRDYYPRWLAEGVRLSGGMWSAEDNHFLGTRSVVEQLGARTVITACTTDWLFKGYGLEKQYVRIAGRNLPIKRFTRERVDGFLPNVPRPVPEVYRKDVAARLQTWFEGTPRKLEKDADWLAVEDRRVRPACYAVSVSSQIMYRVFPYDTFLADRRVADCYGRIRAEWKINSDVWGKAVRRICIGGGAIEDANFGWSVGSSTPAKLLAFARGWIRRRIHPPQPIAGGLATDGSWPNLGWYAHHSATLRALWNAPSPATREAVAMAWGSDPWSRPLEEWGSSADSLFRILTLATHLEARRTDR